RFDPAGNVTMLHEFITDGIRPLAPMTLAGDGAMYGTELGGGVFRIAPNGTYTFLGFATSANESQNSLFLAKNGKLYAPPASGYPVPKRIRVDPAAGTVESFDMLGVPRPTSPLVQADDCSFYGVAVQFNPAVEYDDTTIYRAYEAGQLC